jgi:hypothetical protein
VAVALYEDGSGGGAESGGQFPVVDIQSDACDDA